VQRLEQVARPGQRQRGDREQERADDADGQVPAPGVRDDREDGQAEHPRVRDPLRGHPEPQHEQRPGDPDEPVRQPEPRRAEPGQRRQVAQPRPAPDREQDALSGQQRPDQPAVVDRRPAQDAGADEESAGEQAAHGQAGQRGDEPGDCGGDRAGQQRTERVQHGTGDDEFDSAGRDGDGGSGHDGNPHRATST
jgi:hypothetical protein